MSAHAGSTVAPPGATTSGVQTVLHRVAHALRHMRVTRRGLQIVLGLFWIFDGALQFQPYMLGPGFARNVIKPLGTGQPVWVSGPVHWAASLIAAHPFAWDIPFAAVQVAIGVGLLIPSTARFALAASLPWILAVWFVGEGLSGLASGRASIMNGAPGSVFVYGLITLASWPRRGRSDIPPAPLLPWAWAGLWIGAGIYQALPYNNTGADVQSVIVGTGAPDFLSKFDSTVANWIAGHGWPVVVALVVVEMAIGLAALWRRTVVAGAAAGLLLAAAIWVVGQDVGLIYTGRATDPNTGPLIGVMAIALLFGRADRTALACGDSESRNGHEMSGRTTARAR
jgi:hypothetical protein